MPEAFAAKHGRTGSRIFKTGIKIGTLIRNKVGEDQKHKAQEKRSNLWMKSEGDEVIVAVLESLVEDEPFHSSNIISDIADDTSIADCLLQSSSQ